MFKNNMLFFIIAFTICPALLANTTVFYNGKITTLDATNPDANTLVVENGTIVFVGDESKAPKYDAKSAIRVDLKQRRVLPGFIESHAHFFGIGLDKLSLDARGQSQEQIAKVVRRSVDELPKGAWITGRGWDQNLWQVKAFPTHQVLSVAAPNNPVVLRRVDGHAAWANALAMKLAGINKQTKDPIGGKILRDNTGNPTGVFIDNAEALLRVPEPNRELLEKAAELAQEEAFRFGVTSMHDLGIAEDAIEVYESLYLKERLKLRVYAMLNGANQKLLDSHFSKGPRIGLYNDRFTIRAVKLYADGALGSRGASLLQPYSDETNSKGLIITNEKQISEIARKALAAGFQVATHAIGDNANRTVLNAYKNASIDLQKLKQARFRIEHAQIVDQADLPRFAKLGVIASMQPTHCTSDAPWVPIRLGKARSKSSAYMWRNFLNTKAHLAFGSDAPVESLNPMLGLYAAVTRKNLDTKVAFYPEQALTLQEALETFALAGAFAEFSENKKGQIKAGYYADFILLDKDIMKERPNALLSTKVLQTYVGGEKVFEAKS